MRESLCTTVFADRMVPGARTALAQIRQPSPMMAPNFTAPVCSGSVALTARGTIRSVAAQPGCHYILWRDRLMQQSRADCHSAHRSGLLVGHPLRSDQKRGRKLHPKSQARWAPRQVFTDAPPCCGRCWVPHIAA